MKFNDKVSQPKAKLFLESPTEHWNANTSHKCIIEKSIFQFLIRAFTLLIIIHKENKYIDKVIIFN